jgi:hypothetical protein
MGTERAESEQETGKEAAGRHRLGSLIAAAASPVSRP